jgi:hypothetical protein
LAAGADTVPLMMMMASVCVSVQIVTVGRRKLYFEELHKIFAVFTKFVMVMEMHTKVWQEDPT